MTVLPSPPRRSRLAGGIATLGAAGLLAVAGCGGPGTDRAAEVALTFAELAGASPDRACALLSEEARQDLEEREKATCAQALPELDLPPVSARRSVDVYEQHARVVLADDVLFLARFSDGWKVTAAGCEPQPEDEPYDCEIGG